MQPANMQAIIRIFSVFEHAEQARDALQAEGFEASSIELSVRDDEAGPVQGNFTVGNLSTESQQHTYERNYANMEQRGHCMLTVQAPDSDVAARAIAILERMGGRNPDPAAKLR
ncbi:MAG: hypothetical protein ACLGI6_17145 [Gammaproteobacteria bacterium]